MMKKIIAGNWKQNGSIKSNTLLTKAILKEYSKCSKKNNLILFPPYIHLQQIKGLIKNSPIKIGAQDVSQFDGGAYTGEVSASMLKDASIDYCLVGHSERRHIMHEDEKVINVKIQKLLSKKIKIIYCIGETLRQYKDKKTKIILKRQLKSIEQNMSSVMKNINNIIIAYEPVWAIGTGLVPTQSELGYIFNFIRSNLKNKASMLSRVKLLYGGSVSPDNSKSLLCIDNIDGLLVGGSSLDSKKFIDICSTI